MFIEKNMMPAAKFAQNPLFFLSEYRPLTQSANLRHSFNDCFQLDIHYRQLFTSEWLEITVFIDFKS